MNTLKENTLVVITDTSMIKRSRFQQPCYTERYLGTLHVVNRTTKAGWYLIHLNEYGNPTISIPKKHLKVFETTLSKLGLTAIEINLFRQLRLEMVHNAPDTLRLKDFDFYLTELVQALIKLGCDCTETTTLQSIKENLPLFESYWCN